MAHFRFPRRKLCRNYPAEYKPGVWVIVGRISAVGGENYNEM